MDERERELRAPILADPDDDAPRRVYADWLADRGDERGEFIHAQLDLARTLPTSPDWWELNRRVEAFLDRRTKAWTNLLPKVTRITWGIQPKHDARRDVFERGLVERATAPNTSQLTYESRNIWKHAPIRHIRVNKWSSVGTLLFELESEVTDQLRGLWLTRDGVDPECTRVPELLEAACTEQLEMLRFFDRMLRLDGFQTMLSQRFDSLRRLEFVNTHESPVDMLGDLAGWSPFGGVERLVVERCGIGDRTLANFARIGESSLHTLRLPGNEIGDEGVAALAFAENLTGVGDLSLAYSEWLTSVGLSALAVSKAFPSLRRLDLAGMQFGARGWTTLAETTTLATLHELVLSWSSLDDPGVRALTATTGFPELRGLDLHRVPASGEALVSLVTSDAFPQLRYVRLSDDALDRGQTKRVGERLPYTCRTKRVGTVEFGLEPSLVP